MKFKIAAQLFAFCLFGYGTLREPMKVNFENGALYRWLNKKVIATRILDDMENLDHWKGYTVGPDAIVDARVSVKTTDVGNVSDIYLTTEKVHSGSKALLMRTPVRLEGRAPKNGRSWGRSGIRRHFNGEDWTASNRISMWIFPDLPGFYTTAVDFRIYNDGVKKLPGLFGQEGETSMVLQNHEWNHIVWEIGNVARDKVTDFEMSYGMSGNAPGEADSISFYVDRLDLEKVDPDKTEGWEVWPGRISYSHDGYEEGAPKRAIANGLDATTFRVTDQQTGKIVLSKPVESVTTHLGNFQVMDFSEIRKPGSYQLTAGTVATHPFSIGEDVWESSVWKALNFFYAERCGAAIPGVHGICHRDWSCMHNEQRIIINGGWHDAGDLSQGLGNTGEIVYGLFSFAERLHARHENPELYDRVVEEASWGLDWILKTSFHDGYRCGGSISSRRTNDIIGDDDDVISSAKNDPQDNFVAAAAEAIAARVLKDKDPLLAGYALKMAEADWKFAIAGIDGTGKNTKGSWTGTFDSGDIAFEVSAEGILASIDLWKATGDQKYEDKAVALSAIILQSQQRKRPEWDTPLTGFFYTSPAKDRILHFVHRGRDQAHILALTGLCQAFPGHQDWIKWYASVTLYSEYLKKISTYTAPYHVMPASVYQDTEYLGVPESRRESFRMQVLNGISLGKGHYLRLFPVWMDYRGHFGTILPQAQALAGAAQLRGDLASAQLSRNQLEWVIGKNPFCESTMYGEGYDFSPLYTPSSGDIVGALPVGIQTKDDKDIPYWPVQSTWTYKEIWVHPVARWVWLMRDVMGPALVRGQASSPVVFTEITTGQQTTVLPDTAGNFETRIAEGTYKITSNGQEQTKTFLPAQTCQLDMRMGSTFSFDFTKSRSKNGEIIVKVALHGNGTHHFSLRSDNLVVNAQQREVDLKPGGSETFEWHARLIDKDIPWVAVVITDHDVSQRKEQIGQGWK